MISNEVRIYCDDVYLSTAMEEKIDRIVNAIKSVSPKSEISMRLIRASGNYEALLWGKSTDFPMRAYHRDSSLAQVLDGIYRSVKRDCLRAWRIHRSRHRNDKPETHNMDLAMAR